MGPAPFVRAPWPGHRFFTAVYVAVLGLALVWLFSDQRSARLSRTVGAVERTYVVLLNLERTFSQIGTAERAARDYVLTGAAGQAQAFRSARLASRVRLAALARLTADNPAQQARVARLDSLVARRFAALDRSVRARDEAGAGAAAALLAEGGAQALGDSIRRVVDDMQAREEELLTERSKVEAASAERLMRDVTLGFVATLLVAGMAAAVLRRNFVERARAAGALQEAKEQAEDARTRAEQASRAKSDFLARMSHELRTPLNSIIGFSNVLLKNRGGALRQQEVVYLQRILANGKQLLALINDILDLSKVEAGRVQLEREPVALDALIDDLVAGFEGQLQERDGVQLVADIPAPVAPITADAAKLQQVLLNLIGNALKFTERGAVTVRVVVSPGSRRPVRVDVVDTGVGIPPHRREAIFEAFEQADTGVARRYGGTGLGLAIARSLCAVMGYGLEMRPNPAGGSVFSVVLSTEGATAETAVPRFGEPQPAVSLHRVPG